MDASAYSLYRREYLSAIDGILGTSAINTKQLFHTELGMSGVQFLSLCQSDKFTFPRNSHTQRIGDGMLTKISWTIWINVPPAEQLLDVDLLQLPPTIEIKGIRSRTIRKSPVKLR